LKKINKFNLPDKKDGFGCWLNSYNPEPYTQCHTRSGGLWINLNKRCKLGGEYQTRQPTYIGTTNGFKDFQEFAEWCQHQYGYMNKDENGRFWQLDKDLKVFNSKVYSPDTCLFVPSRVNSLLLSRDSARGKYPIGVYWHKGNKKFSSKCSDKNNGRKDLGYFDCELLAHQAWQRYKIDLIRKICVEDEEIRNHLELVPILLAQAARIEHDVLNNIETK